MNWHFCQSMIFFQVLDMISIKVYQLWTHKLLVEWVPLSLFQDILKESIHYLNTQCLVQVNMCYKAMLHYVYNNTDKFGDKFFGWVTWILQFIKSQPFITIQLNHLTISHPSVPKGTEPQLEANTCTTHRGALSLQTLPTEPYKPPGSQDTPI